MTGYKNAYEILQGIETPGLISDHYFSQLINEFQRSYLTAIRYHERVTQHRKPIEFINGILQDLYPYLLEIQYRNEMSDTDPVKKSSGYVPTKVVEIWESDKKLKTLYNSVQEYCLIKSKDFNVVSVHIAEYRAMNKLVSKIRRDINKENQSKQANKISANSVIQHQETELELLEELLKTSKIINPEETLDDLLSKPYDHIKSSLDRLFLELRDDLKPVSDEQSNKLVFYILILMHFSNSFYIVREEPGNEEIKAKLNWLLKEIGQKIVTELSPYIFGFFKWDLKRRKWKHVNDEYEIAFLKNVVKELDEELTGQKDQVLKKYVSLLLELFVEFYEKAITHITEFEKLGLKKDDPYKTLNFFKEAIRTNKLNDILGEDEEESFSDVYKPKAKFYLDGVVEFSHRYDYLIYAFIGAQNDYKKFISAILDSINDNEKDYRREIKKALKTKNIKTVITILNSIIATVPYQLLKNQAEAQYHLMVHLILSMIGCQILSEVPTITGRIDAVLELEKLIYIIEFKRSNSNEAIEQIKEKRYYESYLLKNKSIYILGLSFDTLERKIREEYLIEEVK